MKKALAECKTKKKAWTAKRLCLKKKKKKKKKKKNKKKKKLN